MTIGNGQPPRTLASPLLEAALSLAAEGFAVFPCHTPSTPTGCSCGHDDCASPGKHPRTPHGCKDATTDAATIEEWWLNWPEANIGVATGNGLLVVDIDGPAGQAALDRLGSEHGALPATRSVRTGRDGGRHLWFHVEARPEPGNTSGRLAPGVDTRGRGGYVLAPPSRHPTGHPYAWDRGEAAIAKPPAWLLARLTEHTSGGNDLPPHPPGAVDERRLVALGNAVLSRELQALSERSADPGTGRGTALYAAAARLGRIIASGGLDLQPTWEQLEHAGHRLGLNEDELVRSVERGLQEGMTQPLELRERPRRIERHSATNGSTPRHAPPDEAKDAWPALPKPSLPTFPLDALPADIARFVAAIAEETQTPSDLAALGVLSSLALGAAVVDCGNWEEELGLYILAVMPSGDHKSAVLRSVVAPLHKLESECREEASAQIRNRITRLEALQVRKQKLVRKVGELDDLEERAAAELELEKVALEVEEIGEPVMPRLLADDATPEALGGLLAKHRRIAILAAEAPLIDNLIGRYDAKGSANLHLVCHAYTGEHTRVDRRGRDPEQLDRPLLTIVLTVQPPVLRALIEHQIARGQGLVGRFAYALPESRLGRRHIDPPRAPREVHAAWEAIVRRVSASNPLFSLTEQTQPGSVCSVSDSVIQKTSLSLSPESHNLLSALRAEQEPRQREGGDLRPVADWIARHAGRVARVAGLLHLTEHSPETPIGADTMRNALRIGEYLLAHGLAALTVPDETTRRAMRWLSQRQETTVTQRQLHRGPLNGRGSTTRAAELAQALVEAGALRKADDEAAPRPGRPSSPAYTVNPHLCGTAGQDR